MLAAGLTSFAAGPAYAIDPNRAMSQYIRDRWASEQGFPRGAVYAITQTADGYLWIGTESGLLRFDGWNFQSVKDNSTSFTIERVLGLTPDHDGNLWVRLQGPSMLRYRNGKFENAVKAWQFGNVTAMSSLHAGGLLASAAEGAITYREGKLEIIASVDALPRSPVISIAQTAEGDLWMGTRDAGLFRMQHGMQNGRASAITKGLPDPKINCLMVGRDRDLWIGTDSGIARWNGTELTADGVPASLRNVQVLAMARDRDGNTWVGTDSRGLLRLNADGVSSFNESTDRSREAITAIFEDRERNIWVGSANGIERLRDSPFVTFSPSEDLPTDGSIPVFVDLETRLWFPPLTGGLWWMKNGRHGQVTADGINRDVVYSIAGRKGELWLGRKRGGLTQLRNEDSSFSARTYTQAHGLAQNSVYSVYQTRDGTVWAGTLSGGASRFQNGKFTTYTTEDGLASNTVAS
ncbi:MAG: hypothetical protein H7Y20_09255, partial [Bryobacteraceae bacterium]|nr:hypothetical protein [Bryobacteraceae bacterium]